MAATRRKYTRGYKEAAVAMAGRADKTVGQAGRDVGPVRVRARGLFGNKLTVRLVLGVKLRVSRRYQSGAFGIFRTHGFLLVQRDPRIPRRPRIIKSAMDD
jgi:hypothetical protein